MIESLTDIPAGTLLAGFPESVAGEHRAQDIRMECLRLAQSQSAFPVDESADAVVTHAKKFADFVLGEVSDAQ